MCVRAVVFMGMMLVVFCYFGLLELSLQLEDPFGFDFFDLALEQYCQVRPSMSDSVR